MKQTDLNEREQPREQPRVDGQPKWGFLFVGGRRDGERTHYLRCYLLTYNLWSL